MNLGRFHPPHLWRYLVQRAFQRAHPETPVFVANAVVLLNAWLRPTDWGFEWGSGQSTTWLAKRLAHLTSVEHDPAWHARVEAELATRHLTDKVDYRLVAAPGEQLAEPSGHDYAAVIEEVPDASLDFVLIDGQMRLRCIERAIEKVKPMGLLVLDGANRYLPNAFEGGFTTIDINRAEPLNAEWRAVLDRLAEWRWIHTTDGLWDTRMWVRPWRSP